MLAQRGIPPLRTDAKAAVAAFALLAFALCGDARANEWMKNGSFADGTAEWCIWSGALDSDVSFDVAGGSLRLDFGPESGGQAIARQVVAIDQHDPAPLAYSCRVRPEGLPEDAVPSHHNFGIELCVVYQDGSRQWISPKTAPDPCGKGWEETGGTFTPPRAVKEVVFHARLRLQGRAWFDVFSLRETAGGATGAVRIEEEDGLFTLENDFIRAVFEPSKGGTCRSFVVKGTGVDYAGERHPNARLFTDRMRVGGNCYDRTYAAEVLFNCPDEAALRLTVTGPKDYPFLEISKTFRLAAASPVLECEYEYRNLPEAMAPQVIEPHFRCAIAAYGRMGQRYAIPTKDGIRQIGPTGGDTWLKDASDGWIAITDNSEATILCEFDFTYLAREYYWLGGADNTTAEWDFMPVEIAQGDTFKTRIRLVPTNGIPSASVSGKPKAIPAEMKPFELKLSEEVVTPHTAWMKPWAGGRPKVFFLVDLRQAREVVELAQRMDIDHRVVRFADNAASLAYGMCDRYNQFTFADANLSLKAELDRPLDAIVIAGNLWPKVDSANKARIAELAAEGVGLVEIGMQKPMVADAAPDEAGTAWINGAVDEALLPFGAGRAKAFKAGDGGASRVVRFAHPAYGGLTPFVPYEAEEPSFRYQDYSLGIVARAVAWAAKCDATVPDNAKVASERVTAPDGTEIEHVWTKDAAGRVCDWSARVLRQGSGAAPKNTELLVPEEERELGLPFAVGESGYRSGNRRYLDPLRFKRYRDVGVNELRFWHTAESHFFDIAKDMGFRLNFPVASAHLWKFTKDFSEPWSQTKDRKYLCRKPCLNNPDYLGKTRERVTATVRRLMRCRPTSFDCGDEDSLTLWGTPFDFCFSEHTLAAEREWLRGVYASLDALNISWGTTFTSWEEVTPLTTEEARAAHAGDRRWASWADHRRFMELAFCGFFALVKEAMEAEAPGMPLDMSGIQQPNGYTGMDYWLLSSTIGVWSSYDGENLGEIIRSFGKPMVKPWYGYGASGPDVARRAWLDALRFRNFGVSFYSGINILNPDFTIPKQVAELVEALRFFREDGGAELLRTLDERPQVLIHYSQASIHAAQIEKRYDKFLAARDVWCRLLEDLCIPYRFVAYGEIEEGGLASTGARILVLPESSALSEREVEVIRAFAAQGGLVVGDDHSATHDIHCNLLPAGALDDLFSAGGKGVKIGRVKPRYLSLRKTANGTAEAVAYRDEIRAKLASFLPDTGVRFEQVGVSGIRVFDLHPADGSGRRYLGFVRDDRAAVQEGVIRVRLSSPCRIRALRTAQDLGVADAFDVRLAPCGAAIYEVTAEL